MDADFWMSIAILVLLVLFAMPQIFIILLLIPFLPFIIVADAIGRYLDKKRG